VLTTSANEFVTVADTAITASISSEQATSLLAVRMDRGANGLFLKGQAALLREQVLELIRRNLRGSDLVGVPTDEEMLILLPGAADQQGNHVAVRLCSAIRNHAFAANGSGFRTGITASMGVAAAPHHGHELFQLAGAARLALDVVSSEGGDGSAIAGRNPGDRPSRPLELGRFIGRVEELASLRRWLDEAVAGNPRAVSVVGEAGLVNVATPGPFTRLQAMSRVPAGMTSSVTLPSSVVLAMEMV